MSPGFVYILINPSMPGLLKIGRTQRPTRDRLRELQRTGVPTPFEVAYELFSERSDEIENALHQRFEAFRVNPKREFFRVPLREVIASLVGLGQADGYV